MKKYIAPKTDVVSTFSQQLLAASDSYVRRCGPECRLWHICQDRDTSGWKTCRDFKFKD